MENHCSNNDVTNLLKYIKFEPHFEKPPSYQFEKSVREKKDFVCIDFQVQFQSPIDIGWLLKGNNSQTPELRTLSTRVSVCSQ